MAGCQVKAKNMTDIRLRLFVPLSCGLAFFLGIESGGFQFVLMNIADEYSLNVAMMGSLVAAQFTAITLSPLIFGWIADRIGKKAMLLVFMPLFTGGCLLAASSRTAAAFMAGVFFIGMGFSVCESIGSSALSDTFPGKENKYLNIMQCGFGFGAVICPLLLKWLVAIGLYTWRLVFLSAGCGYVLLYPLLIISRCRKPQTSGHGSAGPTLSLFRIPGLPVLIFSMIAYGAIETGIAYFADSLFVLEYSDTQIGAYAIAGFWLAMSVSRFIFSWLKLEPRAIILPGFLFLFFFFVLFLLIRIQWLQLGIFVILGAIAGPVWPVIIGMGASSYQEKSGIITGILAASCGLGGTIIPILIGVVAEYRGLYGGFFLLALVSIFGFLIMKKWGNGP
jgi:fucose permease